MKGLNLNMKEQELFKFVRDFNNKKISLELALAETKLSRRQFYRKLKIYREKGIEGFVHQSRGTIAHNKISEKERNEVIEIYQTKCWDYTVTNFCEYLQEVENKKYSYGWLHNLLIENLIFTDYSQKTTVRKIKEIKLNQKKLEKRAEWIAKNPHPAKVRTLFFGGIWEADACEHYWFGKQKSSLHAIIDVATKKIIAAWFDTEETNDAYYKIFRKGFEAFGLPELIITDNRNTFSSIKNRDTTTNSESRTQLQFIFHGLGITTKTTSVAQEKPHIERLWWTLQNRWPQLLRRFNVSTIEEANHLIEVLINSYNQKFSTPTDNDKTKIRKYEEDSNIIFSRRSSRVVANDHTITYHHKKYFICEKFLPLYLVAKTTVMVIETENQDLYCSHNNKIHFLREYDDDLIYATKKTVSAEIFEETKAPSVKTPWHSSNWIFFNKKAKLKEPSNFAF